MKQLAFKEWKRGKKQLPIVVTGQDHPAGGCLGNLPTARIFGLFCRFPLSLFISLRAWLNLNLLPVGGWVGGQIGQIPDLFKLHFNFSSNFATFN